MKSPGPAFRDGTNALLGILGGPQPLLFGQFVVGGGGDALGKPLAHGGTHGTDRKRRVLGDFRRQRERRAAHLVQGHELIEKAEGERFVALHASTGQEHVIGRLLANEVRQGHGEAEARMDAEFHEVGREPRLRGADAEVGRQCQAQTAADGGTLDCSDHRRLRGEQPDPLAVQQSRGVPEAVLGKLRVAGRRLATRAEVGTGAERLAVGSQHNGPALGIVVEFAVGVGDLGDQLPVEEIVRRSVDFDGRDTIREAHVDVGIGA